MQELLTVLMIWLAASQGLPAVDEPPRVERISPTAMAEARRERLAATDVAALRTSATDASGSSPDVHAFYDDLERTIYLPDDWSAASPAAVSMLVHELVHHLQNVGGASHECAAIRERPAYRAQSRWLELVGTDLEAEFGIDPMTLLVRTSCIY